MRRWLLASSLVVVVAASFIVPLPYIQIRPGVALDLPPLIHMGRPPAGRVSGRLLMTAVTLAEPSAVSAATSVVTHDSELVSRQLVIPAGVNEKEYQAAQVEVFSESAQVAAAVGLRQAGFAVTATGDGAQVVGVVSGSPADGVLNVGDVITAVDAYPVRLASDLEAVTSRAKGGEMVTLTVHRVSSVLHLQVVLRRVSDLGRPGLGVVVRTVGQHIDLPFPVEVAHDNVGGPSAGMMIALTVFELAQVDDVTRGRVIAGTGTIDLGGTVGPIGGIKEKVLTARRAGATVFLAPRDQAKAAASAAPRGIKVIPVSTLAEAIAALR